MKSFIAAATLALLSLASAAPAARRQLQDTAGLVLETGQDEFRGGITVIIGTPLAILEDILSVGVGSTTIVDRGSLICEVFNAQASLGTFTGNVDLRFPVLTSITSISCSVGAPSPPVWPVAIPSSTVAPAAPTISPIVTPSPAVARPALPGTAIITIEIAQDTFVQMDVTIGAVFDTDFEALSLSVGNIVGVANQANVVCVANKNQSSDIAGTFDFNTPADFGAVLTRITLIVCSEN